MLRLIFYTLLVGSMFETPWAYSTIYDEIPYTILQEDSYTGYPASRLEVVSHALANTDLKYCIILTHYFCIYIRKCIALLSSLHISKHIAIALLITFFLSLKSFK